MVRGLKTGKAFQRTVVLIAWCVVWLAGCSDPQADQRARFCKAAGLKPEMINECRRSPDDFNRIMEPIRVRQEQEERAVFAKALATLPARTIPKDRYEPVSLEQLDKTLDGVDLIELSKMATHAMFGKRVKVQGWVAFHPTEFNEHVAEYVTVHNEDSDVMADLESLDRTERAFVKSRCEYIFENCRGEFYGVIGPVKWGQTDYLGLQIEYVEIAPKKSETKS